MIGMRAIMDELQSFPHCISLSTEFLTSPKADAEIVVNVTVIRKGKSFATASCVVSEPNGTPVVACLGTFGTLSGEGVEESPMHGHYSRPPAIPPHPEDAADGFILMWTAGWGDPSHPNVNGFPPFAGNFDFKTTKAHFDDVLKKIKVSRTLEAGHETRVDLGLDLDLWVSTKDGREMDCFTAAGLSDFLGSLVSTRISSAISAQVIDIHFQSLELRNPLHARRLRHPTGLCLPTQYSLPHRPLLRSTNSKFAIPTYPASHAHQAREARRV
jgi:acyl-CoA thioesterase